VELAAVQQVVTAMTKAQCSLVALWQLPCDIVMAGSTKWKWHQKRKRVTINQRCGSVSGGMAATAMQHCCGRKWALQSGSGSIKKKKGNNQLEVWQCEWWHGGNCHVTLLWQAVGNAKWKWQQTKKNQLEVQQHEWWHGSNCHVTLSWQAVGSAKWK